MEEPTTPRSFWNGFGKLCWIASLYFVGVFYFMSGFLLSRQELTNTSLCSLDGVEPGCLPLLEMLPHSQRAVIVIIDALRYDMTVFDDTLDAYTCPPYRNKLPAIQTALGQNPLGSRLFEFRADAPTTTMQRLKGLTTGGLPTFVDAGSNFASEAIAEDNFLSQASAKGWNITMMGDDTWLNLFPNSFTTSHPFPSFDVRDLNSVDNGVKRLLGPALAEPNWRMLIAHFLGVDHCGHRYGPSHPSMGVKLSEMNSVLDSVIKNLPPNTTLFVLGDHGMTADGDHGGDSENELSSALFVYSDRALGYPPRMTKNANKQGSHDIISQIDFAPTLSMMLGLPIPFGSLGQAHAQLVSSIAKNNDNADFDHSDDIKLLRKQLIVARSNAMQVRRYLKVYSSLSSIFTPEFETELNTLYKNAEDLFVVLQKHEHEHAHEHKHKHLNTTTSGDVARYREARKLFESFISIAQTKCRELWASFDLRAMYVGLTVFFIAVLIALVEVFRLGPHSNNTHSHRSSDIDPRRYRHATVVDTSHVLRLSLFATIGWVVGAVLEVVVGDGKRYSPFGWAFVSITIYMVKSRDRVGAFFSEVIAIVFPGSSYNDRKQNEVGVDTIVTTFGLLVHMICCFSNSFVVHHDAILSTIIVSILTAQLFSKWFRVRPDTVAAYVVTATCVRLSSLTRTCREEQYMCERQAFSEIPAVIALVICIAVPRWWFQSNAATEGGAHSRSVFLPFIFIGIIAHWATDMIDEIKNSVPHDFEDLNNSNLEALRTNANTLNTLETAGLVRSSSVKVMCARLVYLLVFINVGLILRYPVCADVSFTEAVTKAGKEIAPPQLKMQGLNTFLAAPVILLLGVLVLPFLMLLDIQAAMSTALAVVQISAFLKFRGGGYEAAQSAAVTESAAHTENTQQQAQTRVQATEWSSAVVWYLFAVQYFYASGHQPSIPCIQWTSGLIGIETSDNASNAFSAMLISFNTFGVYFLFALALPLLSVWSAELQSSVPADQQTGDFWIHKMRPHELDRVLIRTTTCFLSASGMCMFASLVAATLLRRHLFVWKIFAPRVIFDAFALIPTCVGSLLGLVYIARVRGLADTTDDHVRHIFETETAKKQQQQQEKQQQEQQQQQQQQQ